MWQDAFCFDGLRFRACDPKDNNQRWYTTYTYNFYMLLLLHIWPVLHAPIMSQCVCSSILSYLHTMWATFNVCRGMGVRINGGTAERYMYKYLNPDLCLQRTSKGVSASFH